MSAVASSSASGATTTFHDEEIGIRFLFMDIAKNAALAFHSVINDFRTPSMASSTDRKVHEEMVKLISSKYNKRGFTLEGSRLSKNDDVTRNPLYSAIIDGALSVYTKEVAPSDIFDRIARVPATRSTSNVSTNAAALRTGVYLMTRAAMSSREQLKNRMAEATAVAAMFAEGGVRAALDKYLSARWYIDPVTNAREISIFNVDPSQWLNSMLQPIADESEREQTRTYLAAVDAFTLFYNSKGGFQMMLGNLEFRPAMTSETVAMAAAWFGLLNGLHGYRSDKGVDPDVGVPTWAFDSKVPYSLPSSVTAARELQMSAKRGIRR